MNREDKLRALGPEDDVTKDDAAVSIQRREAMRKMGSYGAYVAPAMLALLYSRNAAASPV